MSDSNDPQGIDRRRVLRGMIRAHAKGPSLALDMKQDGRYMNADFAFVLGTGLA